MARRHHRESTAGGPCGRRRHASRLVGHAAPVPIDPRRPHQLHRKIFRGSAVVAAGTLTRNELRSSAWRRVFHDVYVCACVPVTHTTRAIAAAGTLLPGAVVSGPSAAVLWGVDAAGDEDDVELTVPPGRSVTAVRGVRVRRRLLPADSLTTRRRVRVTTPVATALDIARWTEGDEAVVLLDRLVAARVVDLGALRAAATSASGPGSRRARAAADLADGLAGSPQETRLRLLLHRSRLPRPVAQHVVRDLDGFVARVDFAWPEGKVAVEYEGRWHGERQQVARDRRRLNRLTAAGWTVVFVTAEDLADPVGLVARIAAALAAAP
jgi:very-short-patch-repair endonuclease